MSAQLDQLLLLGLLTSSAHWIVARSHIMSWFWGSARGWLAKLLACPACSGFWLGIAGGIAGLRPVTVAASPWIAVPAETFMCGLLGVYLTPVFEAGLLWGLALSAIEQVPDETPASESEPQS